MEPPAEPSQRPTVTVEQEREASTAPAAKTYTVKKGDTGWPLRSHSMVTPSTVGGSMTLPLCWIISS